MGGGDAAPPHCTRLTLYGCRPATDRKLARRREPIVEPMMTTVEDDLATRRKRLSFRAWHRGMREVDLLLGRFADAHLAELAADELSAFEALLDVPDQDVLAWLIGVGEAPTGPAEP